MRRPAAGRSGEHGDCLLSNKSRWQTAHRTLLVALDLDPNFSPAHERLGYCLCQQLYAAAADAYQRALELDHKTPRRTPGTAWCA